MTTQSWDTALTGLSEQIRICYLDPAAGASVADRLRSSVAAGAYAQVGTEQELATAVTRDLQSLHPDPHLYLAYAAEPLSGAVGEVLASPPADPASVARDGYGITAVRRLAGNVGLVELHRFHDVTLAGDALAAAAALVADTDALLLDLRRNTGGEPESVTLLCSYLFDESTRLNSVAFPAEDQVLEFWTSAWVPGRRYGGTKPVWVLTSRTTFSAAEGFAYDLLARGRAVLVGETTRGGANFHFPRKVTDHLYSAVPSGSPVNAVRGDNWEGRGVEPDVAVAAADAGEEAYGRALAHLLEPASGVSEKVRAEAAAAVQHRAAGIPSERERVGG